MDQDLKKFFRKSDLLGHLVMRPLDHIEPNWELLWDEESEGYLIENDSFSDLWNDLVKDLSMCDPLTNYHDNEDRLAEHVKSSLYWEIDKVNGRWVGEDYAIILEQGGFDDIAQRDLLIAAAGRIKAAMTHGQTNFDGYPSPI